MNTAAWGSNTAQTALVTKHTELNSKIPKGTQGTEHVVKGLCRKYSISPWKVVLLVFFFFP